VYRFGVFELDGNSGELRRGGVKQKLQDQPLHVLLALLERPGEVVTREDLQHALWPADTYVDFETGLNTAVKRLREVLGDSAESPTFIGTLPKRGYRFLAAVNRLDAAAPLAGNGNGNLAVLNVPLIPATPPVAPIRKPLPGPARKYAAFAALALLAAIGVGILGGRLSSHSPSPLFRRLSFRRGNIPAARFGVDSKTIVYSAAWDGGQPELFSTRSDSSQSRSLGLGPASLFAISATGQMAIARAPRLLGIVPFYSGTLAEAPLAGGVARDLLNDVLAADWDSTGKGIAVVRMAGDRCRLELPLGRVLYESKGFISDVRISPKQDLIAFLDHPELRDDGGVVAVVNLQARMTTLTPTWEMIAGLAWSPQGDEVWFTAAESGASLDLHAVSLTGRQRLVQRIGSRMVLQDVSRDGRVLLTEENLRHGILGLSSTDAKERELGWLDYSFLSGGLSEDGTSILFSEQSAGFGPNYAACIRKMDGSPAVRLGEGLALSLSPDGKWVLAEQPNPRALVLLPTGAGQTKRVEPGRVKQEWGRLSPDGRHVFVLGNEPGRPLRYFIQSTDGGPPRPVTPEGVDGLVISQDGEQVVARGPEKDVFAIYQVEGGEHRSVVGMEKGDWPVQWSSDGQTLYLARKSSSVEVYRLNVFTGERTFWKKFVPADPAGILEIENVSVSRDGAQIVYGYSRILSDLYVVDGLR
jgi:DNA-binding winged helix-turn-helix (wHTH) protein